VFSTVSMRREGGRSPRVVREEKPKGRGVGEQRSEHLPEEKSGSPAFTGLSLPG